MLMYDSINVDAIPADAECILIYSDGKYAETAAEVKARWPNATYQTISAVGQVEAEWIDCEIGCVWPPAAAVGVYKAWAGGKCRGFYSTPATQQALQEELAHRQIAIKSVEWFDSNWNDVPHIDAGDVQTQFESMPGYDVTEVPDPPSPTTPSAKRKRTSMLYLVVTDGPWENYQFILCESALMSIADPPVKNFPGGPDQVSTGQLSTWLQELGLPPLPPKP